MKTCLITGVSGQTGSYAADEMLARGYKVYGFCRRTSDESHERIYHLRNEKNFELINGDLTDASSVASAVSLTKPEILLNAGAMSFVATSFKEASHTMSATGISVLNVLEAVRWYSPHTRVVQSSSSEMFGSAFDERIVDGQVEKYQDENTRFQPVSPYAIAKLCGHHFVQLYRKSYNLFACSSIAMNHESARRGKSFITRKITDYVGRLVANCVENKEQIKNGKYIYNNEKLINFPKLRLGNIKASRDWSHAKDIVLANLLMANHTQPDDFLVASGESRTVEEFLTIAFTYVNLDYRNFICIDEAYFRPLEVDFLKGDSSKIRKILGWKPTYSFDDLVKEMLEYDININASFMVNK